MVIRFPKSRIAALRKRENLSQEDFAAILGVAQTTVSAWERDVNEPSLMILNAIACYFGVSIGYLAGYED